MAQGWHGGGTGMAQGWHEDGTGMAQRHSGMGQGWHRDGTGLARGDAVHTARHTITARGGTAHSQQWGAGLSGARPMRSWGVGHVIRTGYIRVRGSAVEQSPRRGGWVAVVLQLPCGATGAQRMGVNLWMIQAPDRRPPLPPPHRPGAVVAAVTAEGERCGGGSQRCHPSSAPPSAPSL